MSTQMKDIILYFGGKNQGPYTWDEVRELLKDGTITENDFVWFRGEPEWISVSQAMDKFKPPVALTSRLNKKLEEENKNDPRTKTTMLLFNKKKSNSMVRPLY